MRKTIITAGAASALALAVAGPASASVAVDNGGYGFVGKGDVQSAFGWANKQLQDNATGVKFTSTQATSQALKQSVTENGVQTGTQSGVQSGTQVGTQSGSQSAHWVVSCTIDGNKKHFENDGTRDGSRVGSRSVSRDVTRTVSRDVSRNGSRTGSLSGVINGAINSTLNGDPRPGPNQFTGFNLKGFAKQTPTTDSPQWNAAVMNDDFTSSDEWSGEWMPAGDWSDDAAYTFTTDYTFGDVVWTGWTKSADSDGQPSDCLRTDNPNGTVITDLVNDVSYGAAMDGAVTDGAITAGDTEGAPAVPGTVQYDGNVKPAGAVDYGVTTYGPIKLSATNPLNGKSYLLN